jgi:very-short-patch-repair endonuclease
LIKKYGSLQDAYSIRAEKSLRARYKKYGQYAKICPVFSLESQILFNALEKLLPKEYTCYYATNAKHLKNNEYQVLVNSASCRLRFLDFYVPEIKKCIEFDEEFHAYRKQAKKDKEREREIRKKIKRIQFLRIKKEEFMECKAQIIAKCMKFLMNWD